MSLEVQTTFLHLEPNLQTNEIHGTTNISISLLEPTNKIILHSKLITIKELSILKNEDNILDSFTIDENNDFLVLTLLKETSGKLAIKISFISKINDYAFGFYKSNEKTKGDYLLVTQFYETEARRAFPCFDLPNYKSIFNAEIVIDQDQDVIFNTEVLKEENLENGKKLVQFEPTPRMPTAILFFGIGKLDIIETVQNGIKFRFIAEPPKATKYGSFALQTLYLSFNASQSFFKYPYPFSKLDLFATANASGGAMENWGAISIIEPVSLYYENLTNLSSQDYIQVTIAHEVAHQWFGDLVSPTSYKKYIWLNETFATYFGHRTIKEIFPEKMVWEKFLLDNYIRAMNRDSFSHSVPIELQGDSTEAIDLMSAPIVYSKGAVIIRQLANYIGPDNFRDGLRLYIDKYAYKNATSTDLWNILEEQSKLPVTRLMKSWVNQGGYPILRTSLENDKLSIEQERFLFFNQKNSQKWIIPTELSVFKDDKSQTFDILIEDLEFEKHLEFDPENSYYFINEKAIGFYHVFYDEQNLTRMLENSTKLTPNQKFILVNDYFDFFKANQIPLKTYFDIILSFKDEMNYLVVNTVVQQLQMLHLYVNDELFDQIKPLGRKYLQSILEVVKLDQQEKEDEEYSEIRSKMILPLYLYEREGIIEFGIKNYQKILANERVDPNIIAGCLQIGAQELGEVDKLMQKYVEEEKEEMRDKYLLALTWINDSNRILEFSLHQLLERHIRRFFSYLWGNKKYKTILFSYLKENLNYFFQKNYIIQQSILYAILPTSKVQKSELLEFCKFLKEKYPAHLKILDLITEEIDLYQRLNALESIT